MSQQSLFDSIRQQPTYPRVGLHHRNPSKTELAGALAVQPKSGTARYRYLEALVNAGERGLTDHESSLLLDLPVSSICARRAELMKGPDGRNLGFPYVKDSGRTRKGPYGTDNIAWVATTRARTYIARTQGQARAGVGNSAVTSAADATTVNGELVRRTRLPLGETS